MSHRIGDWIQTFTGKCFYPLNPRPEDICIEDIAHNLSNLCRFGGSCTSFYSVAEHSYHVSTIVPKEHALCALLHDAPEAYILDVPTPLKKYLTNYQEMEDRIWKVISEVFQLPLELPKEVKEADYAVLLTEKACLMNSCSQAWAERGSPAKIAISCFSPFFSEVYFLSYYRKLTLNLDIANDKILA